MKLFETFYKVVNDPFEYAKQWKAECNRKICGYFCSYGPEELIWAAGALPFRLFGSDGNISLADAHLQAYGCHLARSGLEDALAGNLEFLDGAVFPHTCDTIQRLSDIWRMNAGLALHFDLVLPVKMNTGSAREYAFDVFKRFKQDLEKGFNVEISNQKMIASINLFNDIRARLDSLYALKRQNPDAISGSDLHTLVKASMIMDRSVFLDHLIEIENELNTHAKDSTTKKKRLLLAGGLCNMPDVYLLIENAGGVVVGDDLCTGTRAIEGQIDTEGDLIKAIADRYVERIVCPAKHQGIRSRGEHLVNLVNEVNADGVIFLMLKFCDPHAFDYPYIRDMLTAENIPSTLFEIEDQVGSEGQFKTRCEAFIEML